MTGFTSDEVQVVSLGDDIRDTVPMSFDQHNSTLVLGMMRGISYPPAMGLGCRQQGPCEFAFTIDQDIPYGLGYTPTEDDARHMTQLHRDRVGPCMFGIPSDYPLCLYTFQLTDYFIKCSENTPHLARNVHILVAVRIQDIQKALG